MKKNTIFFSLFLILLFIFNIITYNILNKEIIYTETKYIADFSDVNKISWFSDNIFVWKIISNESLSKIWEEAFDRTEFNVEVLYNIKWDLNWNIIASQKIWYNEKGDIIITEWSTLLEEWWIYILATRWNNPYKIMTYPWGTVLLGLINNLDNIDLKKIIIENELVNNFRNAYKNEVYFQGDINISTKINSYENLDLYEKNNFEKIESGFTF